MLAIDQGLPAGAKPGTHRAILKVADQPRRRTDGSRTTVRSNFLPFNVLTICLAIYCDTTLPDTGNISGSRDIGGWIASDEQQVSAQANSDTTPVCQAEVSSRDRSSSHQRLLRRQTGLDEQLQFAVKACSVKRAAIGSICPCQKWHLGRFELTDGLSGDSVTGKAISAADQESRFKLADISCGEVWREPGIGHQRCPAWDTSGALQHGERGDHKGVMLGHKATKIRLRRLIYEEVCQRVNANFDGVTGLLIGGDMHNRQFPALVGGPDNSRHRLLAEGRERSAHAPAIIVDNLDIIRAFDNASSDKLLGLVRSIDCGNGQAILGKVPTWCGDARAC